MTDAVEMPCPWCGCRLRLPAGTTDLPEADCPECGRGLQGGESGTCPDAPPRLATQGYDGRREEFVTTDAGGARSISVDPLATGWAVAAGVAAVVGLLVWRDFGGGSTPAATPERPAVVDEVVPNEPVAPEPEAGVVREADEVFAVVPAAAADAAEPPAETTLPDRPVDEVAATDEALPGVAEPRAVPIRRLSLATSEVPPADAPTSVALIGRDETAKRLTRTFASVGPLSEVPFGRVRLWLAERVGVPIVYAEGIEPDAFEERSVSLEGGEGLIAGELLAEAASSVGLRLEVARASVTLDTE